MTYRIVDMATNARVGGDIVSENADQATAKARMLARLAGGSFIVQVSAYGWWRTYTTVTGGPAWS